MQTIKTPDGQVFKFPAEMSRAQIAEALKRRLGNQQPPQNKTGYLEGAFINAPVRGGIGITEYFDTRKAAKSAAKANFYDVNSIENMKRAAQMRMSPQMYQQVFESEEGNEYLQVLAGQGLTPTQMLERIQKRNPELGTDFSENGWSGQITSIFNRYEAENPAKAEEAYSEGEEALSSLAKKEQLKTKFPMSDVGQRGANIYANAPGVMEWAKGAFKDPLASLAFISEVATESAPAIGAGIATGIITKNKRAAAGIMVLSGAPRTYSGEFVEFLRSQDIDTSDPYAIKAAISNDEILAEANKRGFTKAAIVGFFEGLGMKAGGGILRQAFAQAGTGSTGELGSDIALDGVENIDWKEVVLEGIAELATTPGEYTIIKGRGLFKNGKLMGSEDLSMLPEFEKLAAADVARALDEISKSEGYKLGNVDPSSSKGAKQALEDVRSTNVQVVNDLKKILSKKLDPKNAQSLEELLSVFSPATAGIGAGKKKVSQKVTTGQIEALAELVGDTKEGQQLLQELVKSNVITDLFKGGMKGGVSQFTDLMNPLSHTGAVYDPTRWANVFVGGGAAVASKGATLIIPAGGRVVDFFTGRRSKVSKFVKNNKKALGLPDADGTSVIEEKSKKKADAKSKRQAIAKIATILDAPKAGFVENILLGTGLERNGLETVLNSMAGEFGDNADFISVLNDIQKNLSGYEGVAYLDNLSEIIPVIGAYAQKNNPDLVTNTPDNPLLKRSFDGPNVQTDMPNMGGGGANTDTTGEFGSPKFTTPENYNRGIEANKLAAETLSLQAQNDQQLSRPDKAVVASALDQLQFNLGSNPTVNAQAIFEQAAENVNQDVAVKYIKPYVDRVIRQQRPKGLLAAAEAGVVPDVDTDTVAEPDAQTEVQQPQTDLYNDALNLVNEERKVSTSYLQRKLDIKYNEASDLVERLQAEGIISEANHVGKRTINEEALNNAVNQDPDVKLSQNLNLGNLQPNVPELWTTPPQAYDSAATSINKNKNPAGYTKLKKQGVFKEGQTVVDIGGGKFDNVVDEMAEEGVTVKVYDPFNRTPEHNAQVASEVADGKADVAVSNNTLNVIQEPENMSRVIQQAHNAIPTGAKAYFTVYEGSKDSVGKETTQGYQRNEPVTSYIPKLEQVFGKGNVERKGDLLIATKEDAPVNQNDQSPILNREQNPLNIDQGDLQATNVDIMPNAEELAAMKDETKKYKPEQKRTLVEAVDLLNEKWQKATGRTEPFEYTPENVDRISSLMATEAMQALKKDNNAIGWYDRKLKAAKAVVSLVDPRVTQSPDAEAAFDFALAVTSNGQAVADNFEYALEVFRHFMDNGVMPTDTWIKGGERNNGMVDAFEFFNVYSASGQNMPIQEFLDLDFTVRDLKEWVGGFNAREGTEVKVPSSEGQDETVKGSFIIGPKIGQGFYQNIRGNYDPLTMDIWWMRMWNRLVGRPFETTKDLNKNRAAVRKSLVAKNQDKLEKRLTNQTLKELGINRSDLKNDETFDTFVSKLESNYQSFFRKRSQELKGTKQKVEKPNLFKSTGTMVRNMVPQLQGIPKGPNERSYMRTVTAAAIEKLRQNGYMIDTADFQALMWYPEKQLFRKLGVAPGRGADNDYLDAAIMLAEKEGFTNAEINQALPTSDGDGAVNSQPDTERQDGPGNPGVNRAGPETPRLSQSIPGGILANPSQRQSNPRRTLPTNEEFKSEIELAGVPFKIGLKGGKFENGLKDFFNLKRLADAFMINLTAYNNHSEMRKRSLGTGDSTQGLFNQKNREAKYLTAGTEMADGTVIDVNSSYITAIHELTHGIAGANPEGYAGGIGAGMRSDALEKVSRFNYLNLRNDPTYKGTFEDEVAKLLDIPDAEKGEIISEIINLQDAASYQSIDGTEREVRDLQKSKDFVLEKANEIASEPNFSTNPNLKTAKAAEYLRDMAPIIAQHQQYVRGVYEMSVEPIIYYLYDPKAFKVLAPKSAKMVQDFFKESSIIRFYNHPLALGVAVVLAMMMKQEQADEEDRQMPPGALSPQQQMMAPGALTAA